MPGIAREGTWVLWTADALSEPGQTDLQGGAEEPAPHAAAAAAKQEWSTIFTWNITHPPPLRPAAVGGGAGLGRGTAATTLFVVVSGETREEAARRAGEYEEGRKGAVVSGKGDAEGGGRVWTLGIAPEVAFRCAPGVRGSSAVVV